jgi:hypothetical protein
MKITILISIAIAIAMSSTSRAQDTPNTANELAQNSVTTAKAYLRDYSGGGWRLTVQSRVDAITILSLTINRGNCGPDADSRRLPVVMRFGQTWSGYLSCNPIEAVVGTDAGVATFVWSN